MATVSGLGGWLAVAGSPNVKVHNAEYTMETEGEADDVTTSATGDWRAGFPIIKKVNSIVLRVPEDDAANPILAGMVENAVLDLWLKRGASTIYDKVTGTIVRSIRVTNDQTKARVLEVTTEYGSLARNASAPTFPP